MPKGNNKKIALFYVKLSGAGGERVIVDLANDFSKKDVSVDVVLMSKRGPLVDKLYSDVRTIELGVPTFSRAIFALSGYLLREKPNAVISISPHTHLVSFFAKIVSFSFKTKLIFRVGIPYSYIFTNKSKFKERIVLSLIKLLYPTSGQVVAVSKGIADDISKVVGLGRKKIKVIYNPKDLIGIRESSLNKPKHPWFRDQKPIIIGVGRLTKQKDFATLVEAFGILKRDIDSKLIILGEGAYRDSLKRQVEKLGLGNYVDMPGFKNNPESYVRHSDIFVSTSLWEGMPNAIIESLIVGTPVIATDCPYGPREILSPDSNYKNMLGDETEYAKYGILVPLSSPESVANSIKNILGNLKLKKEYQKKSLERSKFFDQDLISKEYLNLIYPND